MEGFRLSEDDERKIKALSREAGIAKRVIHQIFHLTSRFMIPSLLVSTDTKTLKLPSHCHSLEVSPKISMESTLSVETLTSCFLVILVQLNLKSSNMLKRLHTEQFSQQVKVRQQSVSRQACTKTR
jgi:hypothetical protein